MDDVTSSPVNIFHQSSTLRCKKNSSPVVIRHLPTEVVNKIAAGEVIHRPVNAVKEMLENSLDAGATNIQIILCGGGTESIEIIDNGHGIAKFNSSLLCQRHSTSKLNTSDDLSKVTTFGFRGEALASISAVSSVKVSTFSKSTDNCGWTATYKDGHLVEGSMKVSYMPEGTKILIDKIFDGVPVRKRAIGCNHDERTRICDLVTRYAIHNCDKATISVREAKCSNDFVCSIAPKELKHCVGSFFGPEIEREAIELNIHHDKYRFDGRILLSQATSNVKKFNFILFVNNRLVECPALKKDIDALMTEFSNSKATQRFVYIALRVNPADIDVNVHPAKTRVTLHYQSELIEFIVDTLKETLNDKTFTQQIKVNSSQRQPTLIDYSPMTRGKRVHSSSSPLEDDTRLKLLAPNALLPTPSKRPSNLIHNHHSDRKLTELYNKDSEPMVLSQTMSSKSINDELSPTAEPEAIPTQLSTSVPKRDKKIPLKLRALQNLRQEVGRNNDSSMTTFLKESIFVGSFNGDHALIQNSTKLYVIKLQHLLKEMYYQLYLYDFGKFSSICLLDKTDLSELIDSHLTKTPGDSAENLQYSTAVSVIEKIMQHSVMLDDYFSISINSSSIETLPSLVPGIEPRKDCLGKFLIELANFVNWDDEQECYRSIGRTLAEYYATPPDNLDNESVQRIYNVVIERKLFPLMKQYLFVPKMTTGNLNFYQISDTTELYKVFERC